MKTSNHRQALIAILQMAYSGELAAALAYAGHWRSLRQEAQRAGIHKIERDEWHHRAALKRMLDELGAGPQSWREVMMGSLGCVIFLACFVSGWFFPMYFAGKLESKNVSEYDEAAALAAGLGLCEMERILRRFSAVEKEHETFFYNMVTGHFLTPVLKCLFHWGPQKVLHPLE